MLSLLSLLKRASLEPTLTGPLLLFLEQAPENLRDRVLRFITNNPSTATNPHIARGIRALKILFALGVIRTLNGLLNRLALNHWRFKKQGAPWDFPNEVAIVTGGCSGFGKAMAEGLAKRCKHVAVLDVNDVPGDLAASMSSSSFILLRDNTTIPSSSGSAESASHRQIDDHIAFYKCDVTNKDEVKDVAAAIRREHGIPTILINNAGIANRQNMLDITPEQLRRIFDVNLLCHFALVQEFLPGMLQSQKGHIVTIASVASYGSFPGMVDYCATKAGALSFHEGLTAELRNVYVNGRCIQTTVVHPEWAQTNIIKDWAPTLEEKRVPLLPAEEVATRVVKRVLSGRSGQLYIPSRASMASATRGLPHWYMFWLTDQAAKVTKAG